MMTMHVSHTAVDFIFTALSTVAEPVAAIGHPKTTPISTPEAAVT